MVKVFAPVNIAWIKYMGKENGLPVNASLSMTLAEAGTTTSMRVLDEEGELCFIWSPKGYVPPAPGQQKAERFLKNEKIWKETVEALGYAYRPITGMIEIETTNSVPAGTGVATSASGFAALTLAWLGMLLRAEQKGDGWKFRFENDAEARKTVAHAAGLGSGSACRSIDGPFVEWDPRGGTRKIDSGRTKFLDYILLLDEKTKAVPSTEAHGRVVTSPKFAGRIGRAHARLAQVKEALKRNELETLSQAVLTEALDMHDLFHTSEPPFAYMSEASHAWVKRFQDRDTRLPSQHAIVTLDAGANVHVFVPESEERLWDRFFSAKEGLKFLRSKEGTGAYYIVE